MTDKNTADKHAIDNNVAQGIAAYIDYLNQLRVYSDGHIETDS